MFPFHEGDDLFGDDSLRQCAVVAVHLEPLSLAVEIEFEPVRKVHAVSEFFQKILFRLQMDDAGLGKVLPDELLRLVRQFDGCAGLGCGQGEGPGGRQHQTRRNESHFFHDAYGFGHDFRMHHFLCHSQSR